MGVTALILSTGTGLTRSCCPLGPILVFLAPPGHGGERRARTGSVRPGRWSPEPHEAEGPAPPVLCPVQEQPGWEDRINAVPVTSSFRTTGHGGTRSPVRLLPRAGLDSRTSTGPQGLVHTFTSMLVVCGSPEHPSRLTRPLLPTGRALSQCLRTG